MRNVASLAAAFFGLPLVLAVGCAKEENAAPAADPTTSAAAVTPAAAADPNAAPSAPASPSLTPTDSNATGAGAAPPSSAAAPAEVTVGQPAPDFTTKDQDGKAIHLADLKGKPVVVYFYPKDETPGCTKEACAFRDAWNDLKKKGVTLIGISTDTDESHKAFIAHHKLPFELVSDPKGEIAAKYGVPLTSSYITRQSFVIGADGNVKKIYRKVEVSNHAAEIASDLK